MSFVYATGSDGLYKIVFLEEWRIEAHIYLVDGKGHQQSAQLIADALPFVQDSLPTAIGSFGAPQLVEIVNRRLPAQVDLEGIVINGFLQGHDRVRFYRRKMDDDVLDVPAGIRVNGQARRQALDNFARDGTLLIQAGNQLRFDGREAVHLCTLTPTALH